MEVIDTVRFFLLFLFARAACVHITPRPPFAAATLDIRQGVTAACISPAIVQTSGSSGRLSRHANLGLSSSQRFGSEKTPPSRGLYAVPTTRFSRSAFQTSGEPRPPRHSASAPSCSAPSCVPVWESSAAVRSASAPDVSSRRAPRCSALSLHRRPLPNFSFPPPKHSQLLLRSKKYLQLVSAKAIRVRCRSAGATARLQRGSRVFSISTRVNLF